MLAVDLGASGGRVMLGSFDGEKISVEELHRFSNDPVTLGGTMYWDFLRLFHEIRQGLLKSKQCGRADSISVDTGAWISACWMQKGIFWKTWCTTGTDG